MSIGGRVREIRGLMKLNEFAEQLGVSASSISAIELDKSKPSFDLAIKICELHGCSLDWLMRGIGDKMETKDSTITITEPKDEYRDKYIELLERHNKLLETKIDEKEQKIREQQLHN